MPLGIEQNNLAPQLIASSGQALVQGIRQIGEQVSQHLTELQTRRDLGAMAQEAQGLDPQNAQFPIQLAQLTGRHPLAARDERAKMLLTPLGVAHAQWQAGEAEARAFNRAMAMQTRRTEDAKGLIDYKTHTPQNIPGVGLAIPVDPVTGQPNVLVPAQPRSTALPFRSTPQGIMDARTGQITAPAPPKPVPASVAITDARMQKKNKIDLLMRQDKNLQTSIGEALRRLDGIQKQDLNLGSDENTPGKFKKDFLTTTAKAIQDEIRQMREQRDKIQQAIQGYESAPAEEVAAVSAQVAPGASDLPVGPGGAAPGEPSVLPPVPAGGLSGGLSGGASTEIRISKDGKRYEVDPVSKKVLRQLP